jgi:hypothetical protein
VVSDRAWCRSRYLVDGATLMRRLLPTISDRLLHVTGKVASRVYHVLFDRLDERAVQRGNARLAQDVSREWSSLLQERSGQVKVLAARRRSSFDYAMVHVDFPELLLEVTRGRGELRVRVSPKNDLNQLEDLSLLVRSLDGGDVQRVQVRADMTLAQLCSVLTEHWKAIVAMRL